MKLRQPALGFQVITVRRPKTVSEVSPDGASVVNGLRPGVADQVSQAPGEALLQLRTERVIVGIDTTVNFLNRAIGRPRLALRDGSGIIRPSFDHGRVVRPQAL